MEQGYVRLSGFDESAIVGARFTLSRGIAPSVCHLRIVPQAYLDKTPTTLTFHYEGRSVSFSQCAIDTAHIRFRMGRTGILQDLKIYDRRWKWRYGRISGTYNQRSCSGRPAAPLVNLKQLVDLCFAALGETADTSVLPTDVYPAVAWRDVRPDLQIAWLCELVGCVVCLGIDDAVRVCKIGNGIPLPAGGVTLIERARVNTYVIPSQIVAGLGPTIFQGFLELEPVGLDVDGVIKPINLLSYRPSGGWQTQWWGSFPDVAANRRHLAFKSVWRWYRIKGTVPSGVNGGATGLDSIELLNALVEDAGGVCHPPVIRGTFWPYSDHKINVTNAMYSGEFTLNTHTKCVEFEYPVIQWSGSSSSSSTPLAATLKLGTGFMVRDASGTFLTREVSLAVPGSGVVTKPRVVKMPWIRDTQILEAVYNGTAYNATAEVNAILNHVLGAYNAKEFEEQVYNGLEPISPDGAIAQVKLVGGFRRPVITRASRNFEFDIYTNGHQQRRQAERLMQMSDERGI